MKFFFDRNNARKSGFRTGALLGLLFVASTIFWHGCSTFGRNPGPPTKAESLLFNTVTSTVPVVVPAYVTNQVIVTAYATNAVGVTLYQTNVVPITVPAATNQVPAYTETVKPSVAGGVQTGGGILNMIFPGVGAIVSNAVLAALGFWGYLRSSKLGNTSAALVQEIQVARQLLQSVPNGAALDNQFVSWIQNHQADGNVLQEVMNTIAAEVSNKDASTAASQIAQTVAALTSATTPR